MLKLRSLKALHTDCQFSSPESPECLRTRQTHCHVGHSSHTTSIELFWFIIILFVEKAVNEKSKNYKFDMAEKQAKILSQEMKHNTSNSYKKMRGNKLESTMNGSSARYVHYLNMFY